MTGTEDPDRDFLIIVVFLINDKGKTTMRNQRIDAYTLSSLNKKVVARRPECLKILCCVQVQKDKKESRTGCGLSPKMKILQNTLFVIYECFHLNNHTFV